MKWFRRKQEPQEVDQVDDEMRLVEAESRVNIVFQKASELKTIVTRRDQANHWQESVNKLFQGRA